MRDINDLINEYNAGSSIREISKKHNIPIASTMRKKLKVAISKSTETFI